MERGSRFPAPCSRRHARSLTSRRPQACCLMPAGGIQPRSVWGVKLLSITDLILEKASWSRNRLGSTARITSNILHSILYFLSFPLIFFQCFLCRFSIPLDRDIVIYVFLILHYITLTVHKVQNTSEAFW